MANVPNPPLPPPEPRRPNGSGPVDRLSYRFRDQLLGNIVRHTNKRVQWYPSDQVFFRSWLARNQPASVATVKRTPDRQLRELADVMGVRLDWLRPDEWVAIKAKMVSSLCHSLTKWKAQGLLVEVYDDEADRAVLRWPQRMVHAFTHAEFLGDEKAVVAGLDGPRNEDDDYGGDYQGESGGGGDDGGGVEAENRHVNSEHSRTWLSLRRTEVYDDVDVIMSNTEEPSPDRGHRSAALQPPSPTIIRPTAGHQCDAHNPAITTTRRGGPPRGLVPDATPSPRRNGNNGRRSAGQDWPQHSPAAPSTAVSAPGRLHAPRLHPPAQPLATTRSASVIPRAGLVVPLSPAAGHLRRRTTQSSTAADVSRTPSPVPAPVPAPAPAPALPPPPRVRPLATAHLPTGRPTAMPTPPVPAPNARPSLPNFPAVPQHDPADATLSDSDGDSDSEPDEDADAALATLSGQVASFGTAAQRLILASRREHEARLRLIGGNKKEDSAIPSLATIFFLLGLDYGRHHLHHQGKAGSESAAWAAVRATRLGRERAAALARSTATMLADSFAGRLVNYRGYAGDGACIEHDLVAL